MELEFSIAQKNYSLSIQKKNEHYQVKIGDEIFDLMADQVTPNCIIFTDENKTQRIFIASKKDKTFIHLNGRQYLVDHPIEKEKSSHGEDSHLLGADSGIC
ncbi:MAG TPA: hypothetical protein VGD14_05610, partial [bacterium]